MISDGLAVLVGLLGVGVGFLIAAPLVLGGCEDCRARDAQEAESDPGVPRE